VENLILTSPNFRLDNKVALITGSTRGIGLATAKLMAQLGAKVVISSRKAEACEHVRQQLVAEGFEAIAVPCHIGNAEDRQRLVDETIKAYGCIDILVVNAAINPVFAPLHETAEDTWQKILDTNLTGALHLNKLVLPYMAAQGGGAVVMVSSIAGQLGVPNSGAYAISKAAVNHLTKQLAVEWGAKNIRVNAVAPGTTRTDMIRALVADEAALKTAISQTALQRLGEADDIAAAIMFLAGNAARHITGQVLVVDGGQTLSGGLS
jgi:NAD(P)-dependent dehydrogenase (short-subunit alcohol dehydrogenase family)